jgi:hypothetical protein
MSSLHGSGRYAPPHPSAIWPLSANILDPVRISLVVHGPARVLEVAQWFRDHSVAELQVLRVKNRFALQREDISDGYRDLKLSLAFSSSNGFGIIGEVQVRANFVPAAFCCTVCTKCLAYAVMFLDFQIHDKALYELKLKVIHLSILLFYSQQST